MRVTMIPGDGIGKEISQAMLQVALILNGILFMQVKQY